MNPAFIRTRPSPMAWCVSVLLAGVLNAGLFGLMPGLFQTAPSAPGDTRPAHRLDVIRVKRPETPPRPKATPPPEPKPAQRPAKPRTVARPQLKPPALNLPRLTLPFAMNPELPPLAADLPVPGLQAAPMAAPRLKPAYGLEELDRPLSPLARVPPRYPLRAKRRGIEGRVRVRFRVREDGTVADVTVLEASPVGRFEKATVQAVQNWRFSPATVEGVPVKVQAETTVRFQLE